MTLNRKRIEEAEARKKLKEMYRQRPDFYVMHKLGHYTWSKQREVLLSVAQNERTAVRASHGVSKTFTAAEVAVWFLDCFENSKVITTAPTGRQVRDLLWAEIGRVYRTSRYKLPGECLTTFIKTDKAEHYAKGFATDDPDSAEGFHASEILFIFDEAKGIPVWLWDSVKGAMTGGLCRWLVISTTDGVSVGDPYYDAFLNDKHERWNKIHISAMQTPFVTGEGFLYIDVPDLRRPGKFETKTKSPDELLNQIQIATPAYIQAGKDDWGEGSVLFMTKVLGEIVNECQDSIIKLSDVIKMFKNSEGDFDDSGADEIGVDVARFGDDDSTMFRRKGLKVKGFKVVHGMDTVEVANAVKEFADYDKTIKIKVDDTGVGGGVTDNLKHDGYNVIPVNFAQSAKNKDKYPDVISEMWFEIALLIPQIACIEMKRLQVELVNRKRKPLDSRGRRVVESKKDYKARGFSSPDVADAFLLCFYEIDNAVQIFLI